MRLPAYQKGGSLGLQEVEPEKKALLIGLGLAGISGYISALIGRKRGYDLAGFFLGLFGPVGWIVAALLPMTAQAEARHRQAVEAELHDLSGGEKRD
jgi:hypothetical protein